MTPEQAEALRKACNDAVNVQDACNLSGVLHSWSKHQSILKDLCGGNNSDYHHHPVQLLFISKIVSLMGVNVDCIGSIEVKGKDAYTDAYKFCEEHRKA